VTADVSVVDGGGAGRALTERQHEALVVYATTGSMKTTAAMMQCSISTVKRLTSQAYSRLGVQGHIEAYRVLGWLRPWSRDE
jgi:DNA-binding NarL/FixJ family response regulator